MNTKIIDGFTIEVEADIGAGVSDGTISKRVKNHLYSASLECADANGELEDGNGDVIQISAATTQKIRSWAESVGY
jgi:hypothetical protein